MAEFDFTASCAYGLEAVLTRELRALDLQEVRAENGYVRFRGDFAAMAKANLWARTADRIWLQLGQFPALTFDQLFEGTRALPWPQFLPASATFPVDGLSHNSQLTSVPACQSIVKKAIVESLSARYRQSKFPEDGPRFPIRVSLSKDVATLSLDTSGVGLHKRGYRTPNTDSRLRETLAAGMLQLSYWNRDRLLVDPFCSSGTLLIEAAMIGLNQAPGWQREFAAEHWPSVGTTVWREARKEANDKFDRTTKLRLSGSDANPDSVRLAAQNLHRTRLDERGITFRTRPVNQLRTETPYGVLATALLPGNSIDSQAREALFGELGNIVRPWLDTWSAYILTDAPEFNRSFGANADKRRKLYNGMVECTFHQFLGPRPPREGT